MRDQYIRIEFDAVVLQPDGTETIYPRACRIREQGLAWKLAELQEPTAEEPAETLTGLPLYHRNFRTMQTH